MAQGLSIWTIYDKPRDYPSKIVARRFQGTKPTTDVLVFDTLEECRNDMMGRYLYPLPRYEADDPVIVETWL